MLCLGSVLLVASTIPEYKLRTQITYTGFVHLAKLLRILSSSQIQHFEKPEQYIPYNINYSLTFLLMKYNQCKDRAPRRDSGEAQARTGMATETSSGKQEGCNLVVQKPPASCPRCLFAEGALPPVNFTLTHTG